MNQTNWYYRPLRTKQAQWLEPYINGNNGVRMITYVMPIFVKGQFVAVAGVDIDFNVLCDGVGAMKAYQDGYGFLFKDGQTVFSIPMAKALSLILIRIL